MRLSRQVAGQSRAGVAIEEKYQYWKERIDVAGQGGKSLFGWLLEQDLSGLHDLLASCKGGFGQYRIG
ncbi:hypothetical protein [Nitrosospira multiformis]|uniref:hypothetical protein n=1 Tax=Nitrosospira multiformis TaxID=1231 RepID=UPI00111362F5|nr:hypothetical protein [Nitrosospira multiformis]